MGPDRSNSLRQDLQALRQAQQIVRLIAIRLRLEVLVAVTAHGNDYIHDVRILNVEAPLPVLDSFDRGRLGKLPLTTVAIDAADVDDPLVWIEAVTLTARVRVLLP